MLNYQIRRYLFNFLKKEGLEHLVKKSSSISQPNYFKDFEIEKNQHLPVLF